MLGLWGFLSKRQREGAISRHCQSTYHDTLINILSFLYYQKWRNITTIYNASTDPGAVGLIKPFYYIS